MDDKEARLLQARQLLKKYQNKHNGELSTNNHMNGNESCSDVASQSSRASSVCDNMVKTNNQHNHLNINENPEFIYLKQALDEKDNKYRDVVQKLQTLQSHYAELHTAYNLANQTLQSSTTPEFAEQITKLQGALSVAIEEKTSYQSELRAANGKLTTLETENKTLKDQIRASTGSSNLHETEKKKLHEEIDRLARQYKHATSELEKQRRESLILESKIRQINQDRNDYSSRLKYIFNEKEELEKAVAAMKHELQMKEIFIKQLTFNDSEQTQHEQSNQETFLNLTSEKERLSNDVQTLTTKLEESQRQQMATREYYESCIGELNRKVSSIEEQLRNVQSEKADFESSNYQLQEKINFMISQQAAASIPQQILMPGTDDVKRSQSAVALAQMSNNIDVVEMEALRNSLTAVQSDYSRAVDRIRELELVVNEKEMIIENLEKEIIVEKAKFESLRSDAETQQTVQTDVHILLEQLQNEKATVSRAIAQNMELKEQLGELQDKFIEVTNESAAREDQRSVALATIGKLQKQLDDMIEERNNPRKIERTESEVQTDLMDKEEVTKEEKHQQTDNHETFNHVLELQKESLPPAESSIYSNRTQVPSEDVTDPTNESASKVVFTPQHSPATSSSSTTSNSSLSAAQMSRDQIIKMLEDRLESVSKEKKEIQIANDRLQYFLTALESENESIGEYIALYQFQRSNMQKKNAEKDAIIQQLSYERKAAQSLIAELQQILYNLFGQSPPVLSTKDGTNSNGVPQSGAEVNKVQADNPAVDKLNKILCELQHRQHSPSNSTVPNSTIPSSSSTATTTFADPKLHCPECRGQMFTL